MNAWLNQHTQALKLVLHRFAANKLSTLLICLAIGVTLSIPSILYTVLDSMSGLANTVKGESQLSVFLASDHDENVVQTLKTALAQNAAIKTVVFVSKEDALNNLQATAANRDVLNALTNNPLPDAFFVTPKEIDANAIEALRTALAKLDGVAEVVVDGAWIKRLNDLLQFGKKAMLIVASLLAFALVAVIGNTIRMQMMTQQAEIELSRLIGATKSFIRRPFLYAGALYGWLGALFALLITYVVILLFNQSLAPLAAEYQSNFALHFPNFLTATVLSLLSLLLGLISAYMAITKFVFKSIS